MTKYDGTVHPTYGLKPDTELYVGAMVMPKSGSVFASVCDGTLLNGVNLTPDQAEEAARHLIEAAAVARANRAAWEEREQLHAIFEQIEAQGVEQ